LTFAADAGCLILDAGYLILDAGYWMYRMDIFYLTDMPNNQNNYSNPINIERDALCALLYAPARTPQPATHNTQLAKCNPAMAVQHPASSNQYPVSS
jgi:hypothetical protein